MPFQKLKRSDLLARDALIYSSLAPDLTPCLIFNTSFGRNITLNDLNFKRNFQHWKMLKKIIRPEGRAKKIFLLLKLLKKIFRLAKVFLPPPPPPNKNQMVAP